MRLKKGMRKALSLALSTALIITSANIGSVKSKAAEADDVTHVYVATVEKNKLTKVTLDGTDVTSTQDIFNDGTDHNGLFYVQDDADVKQKNGIGVDFSKIVAVAKSYKEPQITFVSGINNYYYGGSVTDKFDGTQESPATWSWKENTIEDAITGNGTKWLFNADDDISKQLDYTVTVKYYDGAAKPSVDTSNIKEKIEITQGETIKIKAPLTKPNSTRKIEFDGWAYDKNFTDKKDWDNAAIPGITIEYDEEAQEYVITAAADASLEGVQKIVLGLKTDIDGIEYKFGSKEADFQVKKAEATPVPTTETASGPAATASAPAATASAPAATASAGAATAGATSGPAATTAPTQTPEAPTPAPTEAPKGQMGDFNVAFNYVADETWGEQTWGDVTTHVTGDGDYKLEYTAQADSTAAYLMILSTDLYKGSLSDNFALTVKDVQIGSKTYKVDNKGCWGFTDQDETKPYRFNIVNPWNGLFDDTGLNWQDAAVTSMDKLSKAPVAKGDKITVNFNVTTKKASTANKAKVTVSKKTVTVAAGKSTTVSYKALNKAGSSVKATAKTSNKKLATVKVTSKTKVKITVPKKATKGSSAKITLTSAGKKATITVKVANPVKKVKAAKKTVTVKKGKKVTVKVNVTAQNNKKATTDKLTAKSSKTKIAKVTGNKLSKGKATVTVKGAKKGTSKLTIKIGKKSVKVTVKVK